MFRSSHSCFKFLCM
uniref:Uncharacterized protein n=1 Tax=Anguilla anguilla TaxID=7936 RepID=A0A0E9VPB9_ANGAN